MFPSVCRKRLGTRIMAIIQQLRKDSSDGSRWLGVRYTSNPANLLLVEDPIHRDPSYADLLCMLHNIVQDRMRVLRRGSVLTDAIIDEGMSD